MKKNLFRNAICFSVPLFFAACSDETTDDNGLDNQPQNNVDYCNSITENWKVFPRVSAPIPLELTANEQSAVNQSNAFANKLLCKLLKNDTNVVISPVSMQICLGMVLNGLSNANMESSKQVLGLGNLSLNELNSLNKKISASLNSNLDPSSYFETQNSIWSNFVPLKQSYVNTISDYYKASISNVDFNADNTEDIINAWGSEATKGMIPRMVEKADIVGHDILLANACYFKADWKRKFQSAMPSVFYDENYSEISSNAYAMVIEETDDIAYEINDSYEAVRLPYGNGAFYMDVVMPLKKTCAELVGNFDWSALKPSKDLDSTEFMGYKIPIRMNLYMPKFEANNKHNLKKTLNEMGMSGLYTPLEQMNGSLKIDKIVQLSKIEVDEDGTKAAAITEAFGIKIGESAPTFSINFNRPFFYAIREAKTGLILFMGSVVKPDIYDGKYGE